MVWIPLLSWQSLIIEPKYWSGVITVAFIQGSSIDLIKVKSKDIITSTVSYEKIISILDGIKNYKHINLLETLAQQISLKLEKISNVKKITIEIIKCNILSGNQEVGVTLEKSLKI